MVVGGLIALGTGLYSIGAWKNAPVARSAGVQNIGAFEPVSVANEQH